MSILTGIQILAGSYTSLPCCHNKFSKKKLAVTRGEVGGDNGRRKGKEFSGTSIKDTWTKPKEARIEGGR